MLNEQQSYADLSDQYKEALTDMKLMNEQLKDYKQQLDKKDIEIKVLESALNINEKQKE